MKKENFSIEGTIALKKAFVEDGGFKVYSEESSYNHSYLSTGRSDNNPYLSGDSINQTIHFKLPEQWNEAMEYAKSYFAPEFKAGDWIVILKNEWAAPIGSCVKIKKVDTDRNTIIYTYGSVDVWEAHPGNCRHATPEEIKAAQKKEEIIIEMSNGAFKVNVTEKGIWHGVDNITEFVQMLTKKFPLSYGFGGYNAVIREVAFSKTGCQNYETTLTEWKNVWAEYQRIKN